MECLIKNEIKKIGDQEAGDWGDADFEKSGSRLNEADWLERANHAATPHAVEKENEGNAKSDES